MHLGFAFRLLLVLLKVLHPWIDGVAGCFFWCVNWYLCVMLRYLVFVCVCSVAEMSDAFIERHSAHSP